MPRKINLLLVDDSRTVLAQLDRILGEVEDLWDEVAIAAYPNRNALLRMSTSQEWQDLSVHRAAGLAGQLNIETVMPAAGKALPWMALLMQEFVQ